MKRLLHELERVARSKKKIMPALVECCQAYATVGEMADVFRDVFGEFQ
ncbi:MAG: methylmalonyl-CoA mutase family protein [Desulfomonilaceae bacterium]